MVSFAKLKSPKEEAEKAPHEPRRITIPASQRLSTILGKNEDDKSRARDAQRQSLKQAGAVAGIPGEDSSENSVDTSNHDSGYSFQVYSGHPNEKKPPKGRHGSRTYREEAKRRKRRRNLCILGVVLFIVVILAIAIGVPLSLKSKKSKTDSSQTIAPAASSTTTSQPPETSQPFSKTNFPVGEWNVPVFLDTKQDDCVTLEKSWECYPYVDYNTAPKKSLAIFNFRISRNNQNASRINIYLSDTDGLYGLDDDLKFESVELVDEGNENERYAFQTQFNKQATPESDKSGLCAFQGTSFQGFLYTTGNRTTTELDTSSWSGQKFDKAWPYAARIEQTIAGGTDRPKCTSTNANKDEKKTEAGDACGCLYKNFRPPKPYQNF